jgi:hypothetical protein
VHRACAILAVLLIGLVVPAAAGAPPTPPHPRTFEIGELAGTWDGEATLQEIDPATGRHMGRRLELGDWAQDGPVLSPDRKVVAFGSTGTGAIIRVDLERWRVLKPFKLAPRFNRVEIISWSPELLIALTADAGNKYPKPATVRVLDPRSARVTASTHLSGFEIETAVAPDGGAVVLTAPHERLGTASLSVVDATGAVRSVALDAIAAGWSPDDRRFPGLAVDFPGRRAFVVTSDTVAEVDLATLSVTPHAIPTEPRAPVGRPMTFDNASSFGGWGRSARWLGNGRIAVSGDDYQRAGSNVERFRPAGLRLIDPRTWGVQVIDVHASRFEFIDDTLLTSTPEADLAAFAADGRPLYQRRKTPGWLVDHGELYFSSHNGRVRTLRDARTGAQVRRMKVDLNFDSTFTLGRRAG